MSVKILKAVPVHEPLILRLLRSTPAGSDCFLHEFINLCTTLAWKADKSFSGLRGVTNLLGRKRLKETLGEKHCVDVLAKNYT